MPPTQSHFLPSQFPKTGFTSDLQQPVNMKAAFSQLSPNCHRAKSLALEKSVPSIFDLPYPLAHCARTLFPLSAEAFLHYHVSRSARYKDWQIRSSTFVQR